MTLPDIYDGVLDVWRLLGQLCTWDNLVTVIVEIVFPVFCISILLGALMYWLLKKEQKKRIIDGVTFADIIPGLIAGKTYCKKGEWGYYLEMGLHPERTDIINKVLLMRVLDTCEPVYTFFTEEDLTTNKWVEVEP